VIGVPPRARFENSQVRNSRNTASTSGGSTSPSGRGFAPSQPARGRELRSSGRRGSRRSHSLAQGSSLLGSLLNEPKFALQEAQELSTLPTHFSHPCSGGGAAK
jgi:hypothetical protein